MRGLILSGFLNTDVLNVVNLFPAPAETGTSQNTKNRINGFILSALNL